MPSTDSLQHSVSQTPGWVKDVSPEQAYLAGYDDGIDAEVLVRKATEDVWREEQARANGLQEQLEAERLNGRQHELRMIVATDERIEMQKERDDLCLERDTFKQAAQFHAEKANGLLEQLEALREALERIEDYGRRRDFNIYATNMAEMAATALSNPASEPEAS